MQTAQPTFQGPRLHWIPVEPSWIVAAGLILLAALPHQVPHRFRQFVKSYLGGVISIAGGVWLFRKKPVLGMAFFLMILGIYATDIAESFSPMNLLKDKVQKKQRWYQEEVMSEDPHVIQERTEDPNLLKDEVTEQDAKPWFGESVMEEHPEGIQERPVSTGLYGYSTEYPQGSYAGGR